MEADRQANSTSHIHRYIPFLPSLSYSIKNCATFHTSTLRRVHLSHYVEALPLAYMVPCQDGYPNHGWLNNFMHVINVTFPHPGGGGSLCRGTRLGVWELGPGEALIMFAHELHARVSFSY